MIAPHASAGIALDSGRDAVRAGQLIEAGLWLRLGGDAEGAQRLFVRALEHDPSNVRARECLGRSNARPVAPVPPQPALEVSVVLLDEDEEPEVSHGEAHEHGGITADVLAFLSETPHEEVVEAPRPATPPRAATPAPVATPPRAITPPRAVTPPRALTPPRAITPAPVPQVDPVRELATLLQGVEDLLALGDPSSALELVRKAEALASGDPKLAVARERCARAQQAAIEAKVGDLKRVPVLKLGMAELMRLPVDPRTGFLLSRIDGRLSYEALFSVSGMSRQDTLRALAWLLDQGIITVR